MCFEGRVPHENEKHDAIIVKGFDTSQPEGFMFIQRFQGLESGKGFRKLGRLAIVSKTEPLPVDRVSRDSNKTIEEPYLTAMVINREDKQTFREIIAGHDNISVLTSAMQHQIIGSLNKNEPQFSGQFKLNFVPGMLAYNDYNKLILGLFAYEIYQDPTVQNWESKTGKSKTGNLKLGNL